MRVTISQYASHGKTGATGTLTVFVNLSDTDQVGNEGDMIVVSPQPVEGSADRVLVGFTIDPTTYIVLGKVLAAMKLALPADEKVEQPTGPVCDHCGQLDGPAPGQMVEPCDFRRPHHFHTMPGALAAFCYGIAPEYPSEHTHTAECANRRLTDKVMGVPFICRCTEDVGKPAPTPTGPVCDHCGEPVEMGIARGFPRWIHAGRDRDTTADRCEQVTGTFTVATVDGVDVFPVDYVPTAPTPAGPVCDHCGEPVVPAWLKSTESWDWSHGFHKSGFPKWKCHDSVLGIAAVNGSQTVPADMIPQEA